MAWCVIDKRKNQLLALEENRFHPSPNFNQLTPFVSSILRNSESLKIKYKSISLGLYDSVFTLVPAALYEDSKKSDILRINFPEIQTNAAETAVDFLPEPDIYAIYPGNESIKKIFTEYYGKIRMGHFISPLIESLFISNKHKQEVNVYLHFFQKNSYGSSSRFEIIIFKEGRLLFFNSFIFQEKEDIAYYTLFVLEQLQLVPSNTGLTILGNIQRTDEMISLLKNYVKGIEFGTRPGNFNVSPAFDELPVHFYFGLLSQYLWI